MKRTSKVIRLAAVIVLWVASISCSLLSPSSQGNDAKPDNGESFSFIVEANQGWQDTGYTIEPGNTVKIRYLSGEWTDAANLMPLHDANGPKEGGVTCSKTMPVENCTEPVPTAVKGILVARIGYNKAFATGNTYTFMAKDSGPLQFAINDNMGPGDLEDNVGSVTIDVTIVP